MSLADRPLCGQGNGGGIVAPASNRAGRPAIKDHHRIGSGRIEPDFEFVHVETLEGTDPAEVYWLSIRVKQSESPIFAGTYTLGRAQKIVVGFLFTIELNG